MNELLASPYWLLLVLGVVFWLVGWARGRFDSPLLNPTLWTTVLVIAYLMLTKTPYETFAKASSYVTFWLQPAVVCLAIPLYVQWQKIKSQWLAIMISQVIGSLVGIVSGVWLALAFGGSQLVAKSIAAKSVTTPIAIEVTQNLGGLVGITTGMVLIAGVVGQMMGLAFCAWIKLKSPMAKGVAMGSASHALGIVSLSALGQRYVAYGTVGLIVNGILTAFFAPLVVPMLL